MNKKQERKIPKMFKNKSRKTSKISAPVQIEDEELVRNPKYLLYNTIFQRNLLKRSRKEQRRKKLKLNPI
jgi:hypothetical protein